MHGPYPNKQTALVQKRGHTRNHALTVVVYQTSLKASFPEGCASVQDLPESISRMLAAADPDYLGSLAIIFFVRHPTARLGSRNSQEMILLWIKDSACFMLPAMSHIDFNPAIAERFRGFLPVVVDVETGGFDANTDALLEIAAVTLRMDDVGLLHLAETHSCHVEPFPGANMDPKALAFTGIDPHHPFRDALPERDALHHISEPIRKAVKGSGCNRAILVGHNAFFDLAFINAAVKRSGYKRNPFHPFSTFDTVSLSGLMYGQTVLAKAVAAAGIAWNNADAHSAIYDAERTAELFCTIVNRWQTQFPEHPWMIPPGGEG